jgi:hypothetical protein
MSKGPYTPDPQTLAQIDAAFKYHPPKEGQPERYAEIRAEARLLALRLVKLCPPGRERSLALTKLEEAVMWANAAIAREGAGA